VRQPAVNTTPGRPQSQKGANPSFPQTTRTLAKARRQEYLCKTRAGRAQVFFKKIFTILPRDFRTSSPGHVPPLAKTRAIPHSTSPVAVLQHPHISNLKQPHPDNTTPPLNPSLTGPPLQISNISRHLPTLRPDLSKHNEYTPHLRLPLPPHLTSPAKQTQTRLSSKSSCLAQLKIPALYFIHISLLPRAQKGTNDGVMNFLVLFFPFLPLPPQ
jgi:hypothetical protein